MKLGGYRRDGTLRVLIPGGVTVLLRGEIASPPIDDKEAEAFGPWFDPDTMLTWQERINLGKRLDRARTVPVQTFVLRNKADAPADTEVIGDKPLVKGKMLDRIADAADDEDDDELTESDDAIELDKDEHGYGSYPKDERGDTKSKYVSKEERPDDSFDSKDVPFGREMERIVAKAKAEDSFKNSGKSAFPIRKQVAIPEKKGFLGKVKDKISKEWDEATNVDALKQRALDEKRRRLSADASDAVTLVDNAVRYERLLASTNTAKHLSVTGDNPFVFCKECVVPVMEREGKAPDDADAFCAWYKADVVSLDKDEHGYGSYPKDERGGSAGDSDGHSWTDEGGDGDEKVQSRTEGGRTIMKGSKGEAVIKVMKTPKPKFGPRQTILRIEKDGEVMKDIYGGADSHHAAAKKYAAGLVGGKQEPKTSFFDKIKKYVQNE